MARAYAVNTTSLIAHFCKSLILIAESGRAESHSTSQRSCYIKSSFERESDLYDISIVIRRSLFHSIRMQLTANNMLHLYFQLFSVSFCRTKQNWLKSHSLCVRSRSSSCSINQLNTPVIIWLEWSNFSYHGKYGLQSSLSLQRLFWLTTAIISIAMKVIHSKFP